MSLSQEIKKDISTIKPLSLKDIATLRHSTYTDVTRNSVHNMLGSISVTDLLIAAALAGPSTVQKSSKFKRPG